MRSFRLVFSVLLALVGTASAQQSAESTVPQQETPPAVIWETVRGYRVQVFMSTSRDEADAVAEQVERRYPEMSVQVIFQAPWHKVRLGAFRTRAEAEDFLAEAHNGGYAQAFIVPDRVQIPRAVEPQPPEEPPAMAEKPPPLAPPPAQAPQHQAEHERQIAPRVWLAVAGATIAAIVIVLLL